MQKINKGLKIWSTEQSLIEEAKRLFDAGKIGFIEIYVIPGSFDKSINQLKNIRVPIVLHAPHSAHNFNPGNKELEESNIKMFEEVKKFAKELDNPEIIVHPEHEDIKTSISCMKKFNHKKILIENMPKKGIRGEKCIGHSPEEIKIYRENGFRFCLDLAHAYKAAKSLNKEPERFIKEMLKLEPYMFHISDGHKDNEIDEHLNLGEGDFDISFLKRCIQESKNKTVTFETPKENGLSQDMKNLEYFEKI